LETGEVANLPGRHFIGGAWVNGDSGQKMQSFDPALTEPFGEFALGNAADMDKAVTAAKMEAAHGSIAMFPRA
jgi:acyl-CoA reductase-like NAD-dependent aldehyde dehydrogenase